MKVVHSLLVVDDNPFDVEVATRILQRTGQFTHVYAVTDGREALQLFLDYEASRARHPGRFPPLLILLDINMPVMNGFEFLAGYEALDHPAEEKAPVVVMLTSSSYEEDRERALACPNVDDYIVKPLTRDRAVALAERFGHPPGG